MSGRPHWEHFPHASDIGVRGIGRTREEAFAQAALALTAVVADPATVRAREAVALRAQADDDEMLLVAWLDAIIYEMAVRSMLFSEFRVTLADGRLDAVARGEAVDVARHQPAVEIKGATLCELRVAQQADGGWVAQCVVDV